MAPSGEHVVLRDELKAHNGWVTSIATNSEQPDLLLTGSRDKSLIQWNLTRSGEKYGVPTKRLTGHSHYVQDVSISVEGQFALSASWDSTVRLWDLKKSKSTVRFVGHTKDVLSVGISSDHRHIVSGSRDKTINVWNTIGQCKYRLTDKGHSDWVSCVRFSPNLNNPVIVSGGWDKCVKVWNLSQFKVKCDLLGHTGYVNTVTVSPDGSLCASGGKDGLVMLWDLNDGRHLSTLEADDVINALCFSPTRYWLCAATARGTIMIWDLESRICVDELKPDFPEKSAKAVPIQCLSLAWSADGQTIFAGYTDNTVRVWQVAGTL